LLLYILFLLLLAVLIVYPYRASSNRRVTAAKIVALVYVLGMYLHNRDFQFLLLALWPISFIWFPEFWGKFRQLFQSSPTAERAHPMVVSLTGWFFLLVLPLLILVRW
jgi:hypothetical protein